MTLIVAVDTETNGGGQEIDAKDQSEVGAEATKNDSEIVELGIVLFHVERRMVIASFSTVLKVNEWGTGAEVIHQIPKAISDIMPLEPAIDPWQVINGDLASYVVAHSATHDHPLVTKRWPSFKNRPWLCTRSDLKHNDAVDESGKKFIHRKVGSTRLGHLCVDYGIPLSGWHRALADAEACARIAACHDLKAALAYKNLPKFKLYASGDFIKDMRELLREAPSVKAGGFKYQWDGDRKPKAWWKEGLTEDELREDHKYIKKVTNGRWEFSIEQMDPRPY